jgi:membrane fusion protein, multidrug efflux system
VSGSSDTVAVRAQLPNPQGILVAGGIVGVVVESETPKSALVIPQSAVQLDQAGRYVLVVDPSKKVELRRITTGPEQGAAITVTDGLKEGEQVIIEGVQKVRPGQVVAASVAPSN